MKKIITIFMLVLAAVGSFNAQVYEPDRMVNPNVENRYKFVCDPAHLLDATTTDGVNRRLYDLRRTTTCEVAVIVVPSIGDTPIEDWCEQVFTRWGIGKGDKDNGALLLIAVDDHKTRIQTGYGVEGVLTDIACNNIIGETIVPNMRDGNLNAAVDQSTQLISDALTDPAVAEELRSSQPDNYSGSVSTLDKEVIWETINTNRLGVVIKNPDGTDTEIVNFQYYSGDTPQPTYTSASNIYGEEILPDGSAALIVNAKSQFNMKRHNYLYPLPISQLQLNENLLQNPGY